MCDRLLLHPEASSPGHVSLCVCMRMRQVSDCLLCGCPLLRPEASWYEKQGTRVEGSEPAGGLACSLQASPAAMRAFQSQRARGSCSCPRTGPAPSSLPASLPSCSVECCCCWPCAAGTHWPGFAARHTHARISADMQVAAHAGPAVAGQPTLLNHRIFVSPGEPPRSHPAQQTGPRLQPSR